MKRPLLLALMLVPLAACAGRGHPSTSSGSLAVPESAAGSGEMLPNADSNWKATQPPADLLRGGDAGR